MTESLSDGKKKRSFRGVSPEQRQAERQQKFLEAALQCYGTHGFYHVTVRELCAEAKLTERYFYESFKNSEALLVAVYQRLITDMQNTIISKVLSAGTQAPNALIRLGLTTFLRYVSEDARIARILFIDIPHVRFENKALIMETMSTFDTMLQQFGRILFPHLPEEGVNVELVTSGLNGANIHIVMRWVHSGFSYPFEEVLESCFTIFAAMAAYLAQHQQTPVLSEASSAVENTPALDV
ncbi:TetR/AcrR family transcriptional regulator [Agitococcus lubricus]|uniref:TetR family transcriptional regulator n=1 Tax=Agitococcus lubricus TaxID=1077255 RepID=A0A2T5IYR3_9GAMM|nr:TetR/AcrR family transcriptional regulator [Agitococcus lubricus]PTQ89042.1 TetR family transcriptional regulator [Agitococcus lubricus]